MCACWGWFKKKIGRNTKIWLKWLRMQAAAGCAHCLWCREGENRLRLALVWWAFFLLYCIGEGALLERPMDRPVIICSWFSLFFFFFLSKKTGGRWGQPFFRLCNTTTTTKRPPMILYYREEERRERGASATTLSAVRRPLVYGRATLHLIYRRLHLGSLFFLSFLAWRWAFYTVCATDFSFLSVCYLPSSPWLRFCSVLFSLLGGGWFFLFSEPPFLFFFKVFFCWWWYSFKINR